VYPEIRLGRPGYEDELARIEKTVYPDPWPASVFEECLQRWSGVRTWLAFDRNRVIGYVCAAVPAPGVLHIANLCVVRSRRRLGVGGLLLGIAEEWGASSGCSHCVLEVRATNRAAVSLYISRGYLPCERLEEYYGPRRHGLRLIRSLPPARAGVAELGRALTLELGVVPPVGVVLGSGLSWVAEQFGEGSSIPWSRLPGLAGGDLPGHPGRLVQSACGRFLFILGRRHHYQGYDGDEVCMLPVTLAGLGVSTWVLTTSVGAVSPGLSTGNAMVIRDHVNLSGCVPAVRTRAGSPVYDAELGGIAIQAASETGAPVSSGVFACVSGPAYETPAELDLLAQMGVDAVSMSTAPEALALSALGCDVLGLAFVTNTCGPGEKVTHQGVLAAQGRLRAGLEPFMRKLMEEIAEHALR